MTFSKTEPLHPFMLQLLTTKVEDAMRRELQSAIISVDQDLWDAYGPDLVTWTPERLGAEVKRRLKTYLLEKKQ